jgi:hypothetical protein
MTIESQAATDSKRRTALIIVLLCTAISLGLMLWVGRHNRSVLLVLMFAVWVASPFAGLVWVHRVAMRWSALRQQATYAQMYFISVATVAIYAAVAFLVHLSKPAAPFLAVPALTWVVIAILLASTRTA